METKSTEKIPDEARFKDFIWFAKRHYGENPYWNVIPKLKIVQSHVCGTSIEYCCNSDILDILQIIIEENYNKRQYANLLEDLIHRMYFPVMESRRIGNIEDMIGFLLVKISLLQVRDKNKVLINMGEKDEDLARKIREYEINKNSRDWKRSEKPAE